MRLGFTIISVGTIAFGVVASARDLVLTGLLDLGGERAAFVEVLPEKRLLALRVGQSLEQLTLVDMNSRECWALFQDGGQTVRVRFGGATHASTQLGSVSPDDYISAHGEPELISRHRRGELPTLPPPTRGAVATGDYIGALRDYARSLPEQEKLIFKGQIDSFHALPASGEEMTIAPEGLQRHDGSSGDAIEGNPESRQGTAEEIGRLRREIRRTTDEELRAALQAELASYLAGRVSYGKDNL